MREVDEGLGAASTGAVLVVLLRAGGGALRNHPEPRVVVDDLDLVAGLKLAADLHGVVVAVVPVAEVDKDARELLALGVGLGNHVHPLNEAELERVEDGTDTLLADVLEDAGNADAEHDGLGGAGRAVSASGAVEVLLGRSHFVKVLSCFENGLLVFSEVW